MTDRTPSNESTQDRELMTPGEVAALMRVDPKTVTRWAKAGRINYLKTPGGHTRYFRDEVMTLLRTSEETSDPKRALTAREMRAIHPSRTGSPMRSEQYRLGLIAGTLVVDENGYVKEVESGLTFISHPDSDHA